MSLIKPKQSPPIIYATTKLVLFFLCFLLAMGQVAVEESFWLSCLYFAIGFFCLCLAFWAVAEATDCDQ